MVMTKAQAMEIAKEMIEANLPPSFVAGSRPMGRWRICVLHLRDAIARELAKASKSDKSEGLIGGLE